MTDLVAEIEAAGERMAHVRAEIAKRIVGQETVVALSLTAILSGGHMLLIGVPGLAKTRLVETLGTVLGLGANRIQFTPDLMPADILGSEVLEEGQDGARMFKFIEGPSSPSCCWPTRSTARARAPSRRCCRPCRKSR